MQLLQYKLHVIHFNQPDRLRHAVNSTREIGNLHIWSNGVAPPIIPHHATPHSLPPLSYVGAVNHLIHASMLDDVMFWMHDDIECHPHVAAEFFEVVRQRHYSTDNTWGYIFAKYDALCAFNCAALRYTGYYDPMFYWNFADTDFHYRMRQRWHPVSVEDRFADRITHHGDSSHKADPKLRTLRDFRAKHGQDAAYYEWKHGGAPGLEIR